MFRTEFLFSVECSKSGSTSGQGLFDLVKAKLDDLDLTHLVRFVANDGAAAIYGYKQGKNLHAVHG